MNDQPLADTIRRALGNIIDDAPAPAPWPLQAAARGGSPTPRWMAPAAAAAIGVVGTGSVWWAAGRDDQGSSEVPPSPAPTETHQPVAVIGEPSCGEALPVRARVERSGGMQPGPADGTPAPTSGQYVVHWALPNGTIEARWPADERAQYDLTGDATRGSEFAPEMTMTVPDGGQVLGVIVPTIDPIWNTQDADQPPVIPPDRAETLVLNLGDAPELTPPCDVLQIRFMSATGDGTTVGYPLRPVDVHSTDDWTIDLNPLIVSTQQGAVDPDDVVACNGVHGGEIADPTVAGTPAAALAAFLASESALGLSDSGYDEFVSADGERFTYARRDSDRLIALIQVEPVGDGWAATFRLHPGC